MCAIKEVRVISDDSTSKECLKQLNQVILILQFEYFVVCLLVISLLATYCLLIVFFFMGFKAVYFTILILGCNSV